MGAAKTPRTGLNSGRIGISNVSVISVLPPAVRDYVHDFDARARRLALVRGVGLAAAVFSVWMIACCVCDRFAHFTSATRLALLMAGGVAVIAILWRPVRASLRREVDWVDAADRVEQRNPQFGQRLVTVTSRVLGPSEHRGSDDMLRELLRDVDRQARDEDPASLLPLRRAAWPWVAFISAAVAFAALARVPGLEMKTLAARFVAPGADILPVTTTRLDVPTGNRDVVQSETLRIDAHVLRLPPSGLVSLFVSEDGGQRWSRTTMEPAGETEGATRYAFTLISVDRDLRYYVTAGDATSRTYAVRVRRPPAVERFAIRYEYPTHTRRGALTVENTDGLIEAPSGTRTTLTVTATEPLDYALLTVGGEKILMDRVKDGDPAQRDRRRRATFVIRRNARYELDLISDRQVPGSGPAGTMLIRALPDGKPLVRLPQSGQNLRLHPREIVPLPFEVLDDYGVATLSLSAQVNSAKPLGFSIDVDGDPRRQEQVYELDLATMPLVIGDVVSLVLTATDLAGQQSTSDVLQVLVSPRSVDVVTYQRLAELYAAAGSAAALNEQLAAASAALDEADREAAARSLAYSAALNRANRHLTAASETATLMRQSLFRALVNSRSAELSNTLANWIDQAQVFSWLAEDLFRRADAPTGMGSESRALLGRSLETSKALRDELKAVAAGERAIAVAADRENLLASQKRADATTQPAEAGARERLLQTLKRAQEDVATGLKEIGLDPAAADVDAHLKARVDAAAAVVRGKPPIDFAPAAREWSQALQRDRTQPVSLDERLSAAAQAEAVRHDADLISARDLQLASRAASRLESLAQADPTGRSLSAAAFNEYAAALAAVQREHEIRRTPAQTRSPEELKLARQGAEQARAILHRWAGEHVEQIALRRRQNDAEDLALRASAEAAARNYAAAVQLDGELARTLASPASTTGSPSATTLATTGPTPLRAVAVAVKRAETIDRIGEDQGRIAAETTDPQAANAANLAGRQRNVADAIGGVAGGDVAAADPNWRGRAAAAVLAAQETLAAMPQQLAAAQEALPGWREAVSRAEQAKNDAAAMPDPQRQPMALRTAAQAERDAADAARRFEDRRRPVTPAAGRQVAMSLEPFAPETNNACDVIRQNLIAALERLEQAASAGDLAAFASSADEVRRSIETAQKELALAQEALTARDPLVVAKWVTRAAADSLSQSPPNFTAAQLRQRQAMAALSRAWDREIHLAAALRMSSLPSMQSVYAPAPMPATNPTTLASAPSQNPAQAARAAAEALLAPGFAALREWSRLRPREPDDVGVAAPLRESEPPGFEEPLRLYFETLGKGGSATPPAPQPK